MLLSDDNTPIKLLQIQQILCSQHLKKTYHTKRASAGMVEKAVAPLQSPDASGDAALVVAWSYWVDSRDTSAFQDLLQRGAADQGKPAVSQTNISSVTLNHS
jgi:hypothetical protein